MPFNIFVEASGTRDFAGDPLGSVHLENVYIVAVKLQEALFNLIVLESFGSFLKSLLLLLLSRLDFILYLRSLQSYFFSDGLQFGFCQFCLSFLHLKSTESLLS